MKKRKKIALASLALAVPAGAITPAVFVDSQTVHASVPNAESDFVVSNVTGGVEITGYTGTRKDVVIPDTIGGKTVLSIGGGVFRNAQLTSVVLPTGLTGIGFESFRGNNLTSIELPSGLTRIGNGAFQWNKLETITFPEGLTTIGSSAFGQNNLTTVSFPASVTNISFESFYHNKLTEVIVNNSSAVIETRAFTDNQTNSFNLVMKGNSTSTAKTYASANGHSFTVLDAKPPEEVTPPYRLSDFVYKMIPGGVEITDYKNIINKNVVIPETIEGQPVISIGRAAFQYESLTSVVLPSTLKSIGDNAFAYNKLTSVVIPEGVTSIGSYAFTDGTLTSLTLPESLQSISNRAFYRNNLQSLTLPNGLTNLGAYAFAHNKIPSVIFPEGLTTLGSGSFSHNLLTSIVIPKGVTNIGSDTFRENKLTSVTLHDDITNIGEVSFSNNPLTTIKLPKNLITIKEYAFQGTQLTSIVIPEGVTKIGKLAFDGNLLSEVIILNSETVIMETAFTKNQENPLDLVFKGYDPSGAKTYADTNGHTFQLLTEEDINPPVEEPPVEEPTAPSSELWSFDNPTGSTERLKRNITILGGKAVKDLVIEDIEYTQTEVTLETELGQVILKPDGNGNTIINILNGLGDSSTDTRLALESNGVNFLDIKIKAQPKLQFNFN